MKEYKREIIMLILAVLLSFCAYHMKMLYDIREDVHVIKKYLEWRDAIAGPEVD